MKDYIYLDNEKTNYYITKTGEVYNEDTSKELKGTISKHGYRVISFKWNGKTINKYLHRLLAITYLNFDENSNLVINHKDGNKLNNNLDNLEIISSSENLQHAYVNNLRKPNNKKCILYQTDLESEVWHPIKDYEDYEISNYGRVKSLKYKKPILLRQDIRCGYKSVVLSKNGKTQHFTVHDLVYFNFHSVSKDSNKVIDHIDGNKLNNKLENLRYVSQSENIIAAAYQQKTKACKAVDVFKNDNFVYHYNSIAEASRSLNVDASSISKVCKGKQKTACGYVFRYSE